MILSQDKITVNEINEKDGKYYIHSGWIGDVDLIICIRDINKRQKSKRQSEKP